MSQSSLNYYDVEYISPAGYAGTHKALQASSVVEAATISPEMLCYSTDYVPSQFTVVAVNPTKDSDKPIQTPYN